jgi:hypothetical protein
MKYITWVVLVVGCGGGDRFSSEAATVAHPDAAFNREDVDQSGGSGGLDGSSDDGEAMSSSGAGGASSDAGSADSNSASSGGASGSGGAPGECSAGAAQCVDAQRQTCVGGLWIDNGAPCPGWCIDGACVDCKPGDRSCASDTQPRTCDASGSWAFDAACSGDKPWCAEGECFGLCCNAGAFQTDCNVNYLFQCFQGSPPAPSGDCTNLDQCTVGSQCLVPGSYSGTVRVCQ